MKSTTEDQSITFGSGQRVDVSGDGRYTQTLSESTLAFACGDKEQLRLLATKPSIRLHYRDHEYRVIWVRENHVKLQGIHPGISQAHTGVVLRDHDLQKTTDLSDEARPEVTYEGTVNLDGFALRVGDHIDVSEGESLVTVRVISVGFDLAEPQKVSVTLRGERLA